MDGDVAMHCQLKERHVDDDRARLDFCEGVLPALASLDGRQDESASPSAIAHTGAAIEGFRLSFASVDLDRKNLPGATHRLIFLRG